MPHLTRTLPDAAFSFGSMNVLRNSSDRLSQANDREARKYGKTKTIDE
jgi:hypothetical protein